MLADKSDAFFRKLVRDHVSGQLKVAPEHCSSNVLKYMGKPDVRVYDKFREKYFALTKEFGLEQYIVPYLMSSHPGSTLNDAIELSLYLRDQGCNPEQVQDFYPTPGTASTVMYYTGINPLDMKRVYAPDDYREKLMQRALLQYRRPENRNLVREALIKAGRDDLIGFGAECLVKPDMRVPSGANQPSKKADKSPKPDARNGKSQSADNRKDQKSQSKSSKSQQKTRQNGKKPMVKTASKVQKSTTPPAKNQKRGKTVKK
jgi:hypothetical protein